MTTQEDKPKLTAILSADVKGYHRLFAKDGAGCQDTPIQGSVWDRSLHWRHAKGRVEVRVEEKEEEILVDWDVNIVESW